MGDTDVDFTTTCGLGRWRPKFMQVLASKKVYMFFYGAIGIIKGMQYTYLSSMLTTFEKIFGIKAQQTAYLMSGNEIAQVLFLFFLPLTMKVKKRPLWCSIGMVITSLGLYMMSLPHFISDHHHLLDTGPIPAEADKDFRHNVSFAWSNEAPDTEQSRGLCGSDHHPNSLEGMCAEDGSRIVDWTGLIIVFLGVALTGVGNSLFWCFGMVYLDDNSGKGNSPFMLSLTFVFKLIGPTFGSLLGAKCLSTYVIPGEDVDIDTKDPRWIGAWWIGFPIIATLLLMVSLPLMFFPQRLPREGTDASKEAKENLLSEKKEGRNDFLPAIKRLLTNKLFVTNYFSSVFYVFAFAGFGTFMAKYMEYQFRQSAGRSAGMTGLVGTAPKAIGLMVSGYLIGRFKFSARTIAAWQVILGFFYFGTLIIFSIVGCSTSQMYGEMTETGAYQVNVACNLDCECPASRMQPICSKDGVTNFYSPCHAGCGGQEKMMNEFNVTTGTVFTDCACVETASKASNTSLSSKWLVKDHLREFSHPPPLAVIDEARRKFLEAGNPVTEAMAGWCEVPGCATNFKIFMGIVFLLSILGSTSRVGNVLVALRCVDIRDKALSFGLQVVSISLLAMLPSPIFYGSIIDNTCLLWQEECGETTNCLLYDSDRLRKALMLTTAGIMMIGVLFDIAVVYYAGGLELFDDEKKDAEEPTKAFNRIDKLKESSDYDVVFGSHVSLTKDSAFKS